VGTADAALILVLPLPFAAAFFLRVAKERDYSVKKNKVKYTIVISGLGKMVCHPVH